MFVKILSSAAEEFRSRISDSKLGFRKSGLPSSKSEVHRRVFKDSVPKSIVQSPKFEGSESRVQSPTSEVQSASFKV